MTREADIFNLAREAAEGKVKCQCGNTDWQQFLYVCGVHKSLLAGCKKCGSVYRLADSAWLKQMDGPHA